MAEVMVIAGTADARQIIDALTSLKLKVVATITTSLGRLFLQPVERLEIYQGALDASGMAALIEQKHITCLVDASHPFAAAASLNALQACKLTNRAYFRFERATTPLAGLEGLKLIRVPDFNSAAGRVNDIPGNILLAIGSHPLEVFTTIIPDFKDRIFVRVLPVSQSLVGLERLGFTAQNILAIKGPFSEEMNVEMLKYCNAQALVTKDSGATGGTLEKLKAARHLGIPAVLIERPQIPDCVRTAQVPEIIRLVQASLKHPNLSCPDIEQGAVS